MKFLRSLKTVFWLFLGVRSNEGREEDFQKAEGKSVFILFGAIFTAFLLFVFLIYLAANWATKM